MPAALSSRLASVVAGSLVVASPLSSCGDDGGSKSSAKSRVERQVAAAAQVTAAEFPASKGRTLQAIAKTVEAGPQVGLASSVLLPRKQRLAFGLIDADRSFVYGKSAVYFADTPSSKARGLYPAPADSIAPRRPSSVAVRPRTRRTSRRSTLPKFRSGRRDGRPFLS